MPGSEKIDAALLDPLAAWQPRHSGSNSGAGDLLQTPAAPAALPEPEEEPLAALA